MLHKMKSNPEVYHDSIMLFELRLRQCEVILHMGDDHTYTDVIFRNKCRIKVKYIRFLCEIASHVIRE